MSPLCRERRVKHAMWCKRHQEHRFQRLIEINYYQNYDTWIHGICLNYSSFFLCTLFVGFLILVACCDEIHKVHASIHCVRFNWIQRIILFAFHLVSKRRDYLLVSFFSSRRIFDRDSRCESASLLLSINAISAFGKPIVNGTKKYLCQLGSFQFNDIIGRVFSSNRLTFSKNRRRTTVHSNVSTLNRFNRIVVVCPGVIFFVAAVVVVVVVADDVDVVSSKSTAKSTHRRTPTHNENERTKVDSTNTQQQQQELHNGK